MKEIAYYILTLILFALLTYYISPKHNSDEKFSSSERIRSTSSPKSGVESKKGRADYFNKILKDPKTNRIPRNIRQKEIEFANELNKIMRKNSSLDALTWKEAGPNDVGGRTRALAIDVNNSSTIIAGGVSGGIWKSTDSGASWQLKSSSSQILSVTSLAQDTRSGKTNTWYYASGEFDGSSQDLGFTHRFSGGGIYKSVDNGESWTLLANAKDTNPIQFNTPYDFVSKIVVNPQTGSVFIASHAFGILKSSNEGNSFDVSLGGVNEHIYADINVASNGTLVAVVSSPFQGVTPANTPGVYKSTDDGQTWTNITPSSFPDPSFRSVLAIAPSNTDVCYVMTFTGNQDANQVDDVRFHKIIVSTGSAEDRSASMPNFNQGFQDYINTQNNYNMVVAVKPDNENFILIGGTSLFRSTNGFSTKPSSMQQDWIGGYHPTYFQYPNFHSDIHSFAFDPTNPNAMWWGHDGGLTYTSDITNTNFNDVFPWENKNNSYNVTQFYMVTQPNEAGDNRIMGGTQDNGTPSFTFDGTTTSQSDDVSSGDGSFGYFGDDFCFASSQNGVIVRVNYDGNGKPTWANGWSNITPTNAQNQSFINPFVIDPANEEILLYPAGNTLWRNDQLSSLPVNQTFNQGISQGWTQLTGLSVASGFIISAMAISESNPQHRLYYAASNASQTPQPPKIYRIDDAHTATSGAAELTIDGAADNTYIHNISVNPDNASEILVVMSNYNVVGVFHSTDGGQSFTAVEGNLIGSEDNPGPSIRASSILPTSSGVQYLLATSTGVYSTTLLNGGSTVWAQEGENLIGNVVANYISSRKSDGRIVVGTHGRGAFISSADVAGSPIATTNISGLTLQANPGGTGSASFILSNTGEAVLNYNISVTGSFNGALGKNSLYVLHRADLSSDKYDNYRNKSNFGKQNSKPKSISATGKGEINNTANTEGNDVLALDDGNDSADDFIGWGDGRDFDWYNEFNISGFNFLMDSFQFFMRTESAFANNVYAAIYDGNGTLLSEGNLSLALSATGQWYTITLNPSLTFNDGDTFIIEIYSNDFIPYPAGTDKNASVTNKSFYYNGTDWVGLNTITGFENGAFLIRAIGTATTSGGGNQNPNAVATISKTDVLVNELITFDASQSTDTDGQITQYLWNFGDGNTSTQKSATHSYSQSNTYNYSLTVTDNQGATGQTTGQITVSDNSNSLVTVNPSSGSIQPGGSNTINLTLDAQSLNAGSYTGQVNITSNGGNINIPIDYLVKVELVSAVPDDFQLSQNYPNPFNPTTIIEFSIPKSSDVSLKIFDALGTEVKNIIDEKKSAGKYQVTFNSENLSSGIYFYRLTTDEISKTMKMILLK